MMSSSFRQPCVDDAEEMNFCVWKVARALKSGRNRVDQPIT